MDVSRRALLRRLLAGGATLAGGGTLSGCGIDYPWGRGAVCNPPKDDDTLIIDAHCHLMNVQDGAEASFVSRRIFNLDEDASETTEAIVNSITKALAQAMGAFTWDITTERGHLRFETTRPLDPDDGVIWARESNQAFCVFAARNQPALFPAGAERQITGFFSNRVRNAARMMTLYPEVDIFLPSQVDFYEFDDAEGEAPRGYVEYISFFSDLNLATRGRFLPLASFTPEREYANRYEKGRVVEKTQMDYLKQAIDELGFVGVKVHPSSGFSPWDNLTYGCLNTPRQRVREDDKALYHRFAAYDAFMEELFDFCKERDVPILTHNSEGLSANRRCMQGVFDRADHPDRQAPPTGANGDPELGEWTYAFRARGARQDRPASEWTNAPNAWIRAIEAADRRNPDLPGLKVILGHLANGFSHTPVDRNTATIEPSQWMYDAAEGMKHQRGLFADLSEINEMFEAPNQPVYREMLHRFLRHYPQFGRQLIYGSDWHMPATADRGAGYLGAVRDLLPDALRRSAMGETAADVFGLRAGGKTRERLERFYTAPPTVSGLPRKGDASLPLDQVSWWGKL